MAYCTLLHITARKGEARIAELTGDPNGEVINQDRVNIAISEMSGRIDNAVRKHYPKLPFDESNKVLNGLCIEGSYLILERDKEAGWSEDQRDDWKLVLKDLADIADGSVMLRTETDEEIAERAEGSFTTNGRLFRRNSLKGPGESDYV